MSARVYLHPTATHEDLHRLYTQHNLAAFSRPAPSAKRLKIKVEMVQLARAPWMQPSTQVRR